MPTDQETAELDQAIQVYLSCLMERGFTMEQAAARCRELGEIVHKRTVRERRAGFKLVE